MDYLKYFIDNIDTVILITGVLLVLITLVVWHKGESRFDLKEIIVDTETNTVSLYKLGQVLALLISTWVLINETRAGRLNEFLFTMYMISWAGANSLNKYIDNKRKSDKNPNSIFESDKYLWKN
jgi:hypothetical protein